MKKLILCLTFMIILVSISSNVYAEEKIDVLICFKDKVNQKVIESLGGKTDKILKNQPILLGKLPKNAIKKLESNPNIEFIEENQQWISATQTLPWGITSINAESVHQQNIFGTGIKVAVLDSGASTHEDLFITGGWNYVNDTSNYEDDYGHGTHVTGTIAALNNDLGVIGVSPSVQIYSLKVLDSYGITNWSTVAKAIDWSIDNKINILNMSFGGNTSSKAIEKLIKKAYSKGLIIIASSGNNGTSDVTYPAKYSEVIAVGAIDYTNNIASFTSTGSKMEFVAPGVDVYSTYLGNTYSYMSGTSMAAPHVTGVAALVWSKYPSLTNIELRQRLQKGTIDLGIPGYDNIYGYGKIDAVKAIN